MLRIACTFRITYCSNIPCCILHIHCVTHIACRFHGTYRMCLRYCILHIPFILHITCTFHITCYHIYILCYILHTHFMLHIAYTFHITYINFQGAAIQLIFFCFSSGVSYDADFWGLFFSLQPVP